jgi:hypothetical protein
VEDDGAVAFQSRQQLFHVRTAQEHEQGGAAGRDRRGGRLDELIVDPVVGEGAGDCAGGGPDGSADEHSHRRLDEQQPNERPAGRPEYPAPDHAAFNEVHRLLELDATRGAPPDDTSIGQFCDAILLQELQFVQSLVGRIDMLERHADELHHLTSLAGPSPIGHQGRPPAQKNGGPKAAEEQ